LPFAQMPAFLQQLRAIDSIVARAVEFLILTCVRTGDLRGNKANTKKAQRERPPMLWHDIDFEQRVWKLLDTKSGANLLVPLSHQAITILESLRTRYPHGPKDVVFPQNKAKPISSSAMLSLMKKLHPDMTIHGLRASFRKWGADQVNEQGVRDYPKDVIEACLAHQVNGTDTENAYNDRVQLKMRRGVLQTWADFASPSAQVIELKAAA